MAIVKKPFSGDHDLVVPRNPLSGTLIHPGAMTDEMRETWEQDTHSLQGLQRDEYGHLPEGPFLPHQAGYLDAIQRRSNSEEFPYDSRTGYKENPPTREAIRSVYAGGWTERLNKLDSSFENLYGMTDNGYLGVPEGEYRAGGIQRIGSSGSRDEKGKYHTTQLRYAVNPEATKEYKKGAREAENRMPKR